MALYIVRRAEITVGKREYESAIIGVEPCTIGSVEYQGSLTIDLGNQNYFEATLDGTKSITVRLDNTPAEIHKVHRRHDPNSEEEIPIVSDVNAGLSALTFGLKGLYDGAYILSYQDEYQIKTRLEWHSQEPKPIKLP